MTTRPLHRYGNQATPFEAAKRYAEDSYQDPRHPRRARRKTLNGTDVTGHSEGAETADHSTPVLVIVDSDQLARMATEAALARRFEPENRIVSTDSPVGDWRHAVVSS